MEIWERFNRQRSNCDKVMEYARLSAEETRQMVGFKSRGR
jgi:hypothetical protein